MMQKNDVFMGYEVWHITSWTNANSYLILWIKSFDSFFLLYRNVLIPAAMPHLACFEVVPSALVENVAIQTVSSSPWGPHVVLPPRNATFWSTVLETPRTARGTSTIRTAIFVTRTEIFASLDNVKFWTINVSDFSVSFFAENVMELYIIVMVMRLHIFGNKRGCYDFYLMATDSCI